MTEALNEHPEQYELLYPESEHFGGRSLVLERDGPIVTEPAERLIFET